MSTIETLMTTEMIFAAPTESVLAVTDQSGKVLAQYQYDAFGGLRNTATIQPAFGFTGEKLDVEIGLIFLRSRYYDPTLGRFISKDRYPYQPDVSQTLNRYTYVQNNPLLWTDHLGLNDDFYGSGFNIDPSDPFYASAMVSQELNNAWNSFWYYADPFIAKTAAIGMDVAKVGAVAIALPEAPVAATVVGAALLLHTARVLQRATPQL